MTRKPTLVGLFAPETASGSNVQAELSAQPAFYAFIICARTPMDPSAAELPSELRAFLYSCIDALDQVDLLMRLRQSGEPATVRQLAAAAGLPAIAVRAHLEALTARGLLQAEVGGEVRYRYAPDSDDLRRYGELLGEYYATRREAVHRAIAARAARTFADAFKLRKEP